MFDPAFNFIAGILSFFYGLIPSYGFAIILLTITVMVVVTPLTYKSTKSMLQMQRLQPELKRIQQQYKDDRERLNQELMAFYKEHNLNPVGGCLPLLVQAPVFIVLYRVLRGLTDRHGGGGSGAGHIVGQLQAGVSPTTPWRLTDQPFNPKYVSHSSELYKSLIGRTQMKFFGIDLSITPIQAFKIGIVTAIPFVVLIAAMTVAQVIQNKQIQGRNPNQQANPQQQAIMKFLPFMLPVISLNFPAGLGIYYFIQSLCRIGTQAYITKTLYGENAPAAATVTTTATEKNGKPADKKAPPPAVKRPGTSAKSQAAQKKQSGGTTSAGRKSGAPRVSKQPQAGRKSGDPGSNGQKGS